MTSCPANPDRNSPLFWLGAAMLAGVQVLTTLPLATHGLRVALSDLLLPLAVLMPLGLLVRGRLTPRPPLSLLVALAAMTVALLVSLLVGMREAGSLAAWPLIKLGGWFSLLTYLLCGWGFAVRDRLTDRLVEVTLIAGWAVAVGSFVHRQLFLDQTYLGRVYWFYSRFMGASDNSNAYAFLAACLLLLQITYAARRPLFAGWFDSLGMAVLFFALIITGSRTGYLAFVAGLLLLVAVRAVPWRRLGVATIIVAVMLIAWKAGDGIERHYVNAETGITTTVTGTNLNVEGQVTSEAGLSHRWVSTLGALRQWREAPLLGIGLGTYLDRQVEAGMGAPMTLHSSPLWVLTEMGLLGLAAYGAMLLLMLRELWRGRADPMALAGLAVLAAFVVGSLGSDLLYQRHQWLLLGLALAAARRKSEDMSA